MKVYIQQYNNKIQYLDQDEATIFRTIHDNKYHELPW